MKCLYKFFLLAIAAIPVVAMAQYSPQVPIPGNDAIAADDIKIIDWASSCELLRGWQNISNKDLGKPTVGDSSAAIGVYDNSVVSLGDSGVAILSFNYSIRNGDGPDFAVFENGFRNPQDTVLAFLELAFVEVSTDGIHYVRFPSVSNTQDTLQIDNFTYTDASYINNLAGKYIAGYGTPFDLELLKDSAAIDVNNIKYVRIVDVVGTIDSAYASRDSEGKIINEPYPSEYPSGGFDLNAIGVLNSNQPTSTQDLSADIIKAYPNPVDDKFYIEIKPGIYSYVLYDISGRMISNGNFNKSAQIDVTNIVSGTYFLKIYGTNSSSYIKLYKL